MTDTSSTSAWKRPATSFHAHFDCFSGAAGDMLLASCLDASGEPEELLQHVTNCICLGMPELDGEFSIETKRVWRGGMGKIAGLHVRVHSKYHHHPAPVPDKRRKTNKSIDDGSPSMEASQSHDHSHHHEHAHDHTHSHTHAHEHAHCQVEETFPSQSHSHSHEHGHKHPGDDTGIRGPLRNLPQIKKLLKDASEDYIDNWVKQLAIIAFTELAKAEATTHGADGIDNVHFHEVGAVDSIVDTVGTLIALHALNVTSVTCSRLPIGEGTVWTAHGCLPVPAPATLLLLVDLPTCPGPLGIVTGELVTPTGAALLRALTFHCIPPLKLPSEEQKRLFIQQGRPPSFTIRKIGVGAGSKDFEKHPNILRLLLGDTIVAK
mmetsp:Transcript_8239/g.15201  ORF Transcript_8239/g.15201 Transcript_8239/m.15201 type:complete len:377 (+) Transcript_8239:392-1522(+)